MFVYGFLSMPYRIVCTFSIGRPTVAEVIKFLTALEIAIILDALFEMIRARAAPTGDFFCPSEPRKNIASTCFEITKAIDVKRA